MCAKLRFCDTGKADRRARFIRSSAPRIGRPRRHNTMVDHQAMGSEVRCVSHLKNSLSNASRGARRLRHLPKNCHLLPSTAILQSQNRCARFNRCILILVPRGHSEDTNFISSSASTGSIKIGQSIMVLGPSASRALSRSGNASIKLTGGCTSTEDCTTVAKKWTRGTPAIFATFLQSSCAGESLLRQLGATTPTARSGSNPIFDEHPAQGS